LVKVFVIFFISVKMNESNEKTAGFVEDTNQEEDDEKVEDPKESHEKRETELKVVPETPLPIKVFVGSTPPSPRSPAGEEDPKAFPYVDEEALTCDPISLPEEQIGGFVRRQKVDVPQHLQKSSCAHCGDPRPKGRGPQCGAFDPTERKWYCYLCWRQFRQDIHDAAAPNAKGENCVTCNIFVLTNQGKYMDLGEQPGTEKGLYCVHCWEGWINSLPTDADWIKNRNVKAGELQGREFGEQERIQKKINENATLIEAALDSGAPLEQLEPKIAETEDLVKALQIESVSNGATTEVDKSNGL